MREDVSIQSLLAQAYLVGYNASYSAVTTSGDINLIRRYCLQNSIFCAAGGRAGSDTLSLIACGNCLVVTDTTEINRPKFNTAAFWYNTPRKSFGFAPNSTINQDDADNYFSNDRLRLSWHLNGLGGWRLGNFTNLADGVFRKYIFYKF